MLQKRTKPIKKPLRKNKLHVFVQQRKAQKSSLTILRNGYSLFSRLYIACQTRKGDLPEFFRHENQPTPPSLSKMGDIRTGKKAGLLKCLERSPLGSGNADEKEILVDETNNTDYEETFDHVSMISPLKSFLILSVELSLNLVRRKRNNWSAKTLLHTLLQTAHLKQMWWSLTVHLLLSALLQDIKHFPGLQQQRLLALHFYKWKSCGLHLGLKNMPAFHAITECNTVSFFGWKGKLKTETHGMHSHCGDGFFRTWYWESESVTRCIWEAWAICCFHVWKEQCSDNNECSRAKAVLPTMQSHQHIYISTEHQGCHLHPPGDGPRTTMEATMDNTSSGWGLVLRADPLWLQTRL